MITTEEIYQIFKENPVISTDTRKIEENCIFFALKGDNFNGNKFAKEALVKGAGYVVIDEKEYLISFKTILVENVLQTLKDLANLHRQKTGNTHFGYYWFQWKNNYQGTGFSRSLSKI
jgi:UDP-N-acetylmuramoyl-tripeptide--D-alanyl-D-alanine ligase